MCCNSIRVSCVDISASQRLPVLLWHRKDLLIHDTQVTVFSKRCLCYIQPGVGILGLL
jgi:hypothetical protein